jgi:hypothetical protein
MKFRDRVSGLAVDRPPDAVLFGQWVAERSVSRSSFHLNGFPFEDDDALVPDPTGNWSIVWLDDVSAARGRFYPDALPDEQDVEALLQLGGVLRESAVARSGWLGWCGRSPLAPGLEDAVKPRPLEDKIEGELHHLEEVCRKPRTHIRLETERVLVWRARRVDPGAPTWLAAHTEDWEHRRITGVQPRRILAQLREEEWNLYENRVAARLVDNLSAWLRRRISEVRRVLDDIFARLAEYQVSTNGSRRRLRRISELWGEVWEANHGKDVAEQTLKRLERLLYRVLRLMDSPLYNKVPGAAQVPRALRMTNLLNNDPNYRGVARLWHQWSLLGAPQALSPRQLHRRYQELRRAFDAWCMLLIVRACSQLGIEPVDEHVEAPIAPGCDPIRLSTGHHLRWAPDGTLVIAEGDAICVSFVPLIHVLEKADSAAAAEGRKVPLVRAAAASAAWTVILHPAAPGSAQHLQLAGVGDPPLPRTEGAIDFVRVSPFSLDSVERVARVVRWATLAPRMLAYPPPMAAPPSDLADLVSPWLQKRDQSLWALVRPARPQELVRLGLDRRIAEAQTHRDRLARKREEVDDELKQVRGDDRRRTAELNRRKRDLLKPLQDADDLVRRLGQFKENLAAAGQRLQGLVTCPVCHASGELEPRDNNCFAARCTRRDSCESTWELRIDSVDRARVPVLLPGDAEPKSWPRRRPPQWVDDVLGCDVLAVPMVADDGSVSFRSPRQSANPSDDATFADGPEAPNPRPLDGVRTARL